MPDLGTWAAIAAIVVVPLMVIGWFVTNGKTNKATAREGGTAIAEDIRADRAKIVTGHKSPVNLSVTVDRGQKADARYKTR